MAESSYIVCEHDFTGGKGCIHCEKTDPTLPCISRTITKWSPSAPIVQDYDYIRQRAAELHPKVKASE